MPRRLLLSVALLTIAVTSAGAQVLPLVLGKLNVAATSGSRADRSGWNIGPLHFDLPTSWSNTSTDLVAKLSGPAKSVATFVMLQATPEAHSGGYSVLEDRGRGPLGFADSLMWEDCIGNPKRVVRKLPSSSAVKALYAVCKVKSLPGADETYLQATFYTRSHIVQVHAVGSAQDMHDLVDALSSYSWRGDT